MPIHLALGFYTVHTRSHRSTTVVVLSGPFPASLSGVSLFCLDMIHDIFNVRFSDVFSSYLLTGLLFWLSWFRSVQWS